MLMSAEWKNQTSTAVEANHDDLLRWYIVRAYSGAEWQLRKGLLKRGIEAFLPWYIVEVRRDRWEHGVIRALFPGYLFAGLEPGQHTDEVKAVNGAMHVLKINDKPIEVSEAHIHSIRLQAAEEQMVGWGTKAKVVRVNVGDWVAVPEGYPFTGMPVQIEAIDKRGKISSSIGGVRLTFPLSALTEACRRPLKAIP